MLNQGPQFQSMEFESLLSANGIAHKDADIESHNTLGETKRCHAHPSNVFERVCAEHPEMSSKNALKCSVKA